MTPTTDIALLAVLLVYLVMSAITLGVFTLDKRLARRGGRRIPERRLLTLALAMGWPGAWAALRFVRHKSAKRPFKIKLLAITLLHLAAWGIVAWLIFRG